MTTPTNIPTPTNSTNGLKRKLAALLASLVKITATVPALQPYTIYLEWLTGLIGGAGLGHSLVTGSWRKYLLSGLASLMSVFLLIAENTPSVKPYVPILQSIVSLLGGLGVGSALKETEVKPLTKGVAPVDVKKASY